MRALELELPIIAPESAHSGQQRQAFGHRKSDLQIPMIARTVSRHNLVSFNALKPFTLVVGLSLARVPLHSLSLEVAVGPVDPPFVLALSGPARIAKHIVQALVQDLKLRPGHFAYEKSLHQAFTTHGLAAGEIRAGLDHATAQGWLVFDSAQRIYTLTHAGFASV